MLGKPVVRILTLFLAVLLLGPPAEATRLRQLNLEEMVQRASRVFAGRCVDVRVERDGALGLDITVVEFEVTRAAKGQVGPRVVVRMLGGGQGASIPGRPEFERGEQVVLFLYGVSRHGLTSPVGLGQGAFKVRTDKQGRQLAVNEFGNRALFERLEPAAVARIGRQRLHEAGTKPVSPQTLLDMAEALGR